MAVVNARDGASTGTQNLGTITVATNGASPTGMLFYEDDRTSIPVATINKKVTNEFIQTRNYTGDSMIIELGAGVHILPQITQTTTIRSIATNPWDAIIRPSDPSSSAVDARANVILQGVTICNGLHGIKTQSTIPATVEVNNCWIVNNMTNGIQTAHPLTVTRSLIEYNGSSRQFDHGIYSEGVTTVSNSIVWGNSGYQVTAAGSSFSLERCLIGEGGRCLKINAGTGETSIIRCSLKGESSFPDEEEYIDNTNILIDEADVSLPYWQINSARRLYWLSERAKTWDGTGCYDYDDRFEPDPDNLKARAHAATLWESGHMYSIDGHWSQQDLPQPHFPGDPFPTAS